MNYYYERDLEDCPKCGVYDHGWDLPDVRATLFNYPCRNSDGECACEERGEECEPTRITITIVRIWDQFCDSCDGADWRPEFHVKVDGKTVATVPSEEAAHAVIEAEYPRAESDDYYDADWESEKWLRRAEGWG